MKKYTVGIIGAGFVGESQAYAFAPTADVKIYDVDPKRKTHELEEVLKQEFIFVCVPTPMKQDGVQDLSYIEGFFEGIESKYIDLDIDPVFIIKSTVLPGTTNYLIERYGWNVVFCPEFLTEKTAKLDMLTQSRIVIGGEPTLTCAVQKLFESRFGKKHCVLTDTISAETIKYMANNFLSVKVSFMNDYYDFVQKIGGDWNDIVEGFVSDPRIGNSHTQVPGHDGSRGFGGTCFPKDINATINFAKNNNVDMPVLEAAWKTNLRVRPERDWEKLEGRAVSITPTPTPKS